MFLKIWSSVYLARHYQFTNATFSQQKRYTASGKTVVKPRRNRWYLLAGTT
jgi:hypothetical protein